MRRFAQLALVTVLALMLIAGPACAPQAQDDGPFPSKPIKVIVPHAAGGGTDVSFRLICQYAEAHLGVPLVVENITGGGGAVGFEALASAAPDGYTIGGVNTPGGVTMPLDPALKVEFDIESWAPIICVMSDPCMWAVRPDSSYQTVPDVVKAARELGPGVVTAALTGVGIANDDYTAILQVELAEDIKIVKVPFDGGGPARAATMGGHIDFWAGNVGEVATYHPEELRVVGVMAAQRDPFLPDVPTFAEQGYPIIQYSNRGICAPAGTPQDRIDILTEAFSKAFEDPAFQQKAKDLLLPLSGVTGQTYRELLESELAAGQLLVDSGLFG